MKAYYQQCIPKHPDYWSTLQIEGRNIDLHQLHYKVLSQNGYRNSIQRIAPNQLPQLIVALVLLQEQWLMIAGRLGFVNFPGNDHQPARSGPAIAVTSTVCTRNASRTSPLNIDDNPSIVNGSLLWGRKSTAVTCLLVPQASRLRRA